MHLEMAEAIRTAVSQQDDEKRPFAPHKTHPKLVRLLPGANCARFFLLVQNKAGRKPIFIPFP